MASVGMSVLWTEEGRVEEGDVEVEEEDQEEEYHFRPLAMIFGKQMARKKARETEVVDMLEKRRWRERG